jgi:hypothetical protein
MVQIIKQKYHGCIPENAIVKYTIMGDKAEIMYMEKINTRFPIIRLSKRIYIKLSDGEIYKYKQSQKRIENADSIRKTLKHLRELINTNFHGNLQRKYD